MGDFYVLGANYFYHTIYAMVKPFLSERTKSKIHLLKSPKELVYFFEPDKLHPDYLRTAVTES